MDRARALLVAVMVLTAPLSRSTAIAGGGVSVRIQQVCGRSFAGIADQRSCIGHLAPAGDLAIVLVSDCIDYFDSPGAALACLEENALDFAPGSADAFASACRRAFLQGGQRDSCVRALLDMSSGGEALVDACSRAFVSDADELECIKAAVPARRGAANMVYACDRAFSGAEEFDCIQSAAQGRWRTAELVRACVSTFAGSTTELDCIDAGSQLRSRAAETIAACDAAFGSDRSELDCVQAAAPLRRRAPEMVAYCADSYTGSRALECIGTPAN